MGAEPVSDIDEDKVDVAFRRTLDKLDATQHRVSIGSRIGRVGQSTPALVVFVSTIVHGLWTVVYGLLLTCAPMCMHHAPPVTASFAQCYKEH